MSKIRLSWTRDSQVPMYLYKSKDTPLRLSQLPDPILIDPRVNFYTEENVDTNSKYYFVFSSEKENKIQYSEIITVKDFNTLNVLLKYEEGFSSIIGLDVELKFEI